MIWLKRSPPYKQITRLLLKLYGTFSNEKGEATEIQTVTTVSKLPLCGSMPIYWNTTPYLSNNTNFGIYSFAKFAPSRLWHCVALQKWGASWFVSHTKHLDHQIQQDGTGGQVAHRNAYRDLVWKPKVNRPCGKIGQRCEENIKMDLTETEQVGVGWIQVAWDRDTGIQLSTWLSVFIFHTAGISWRVVKRVTFW